MTRIVALLAAMVPLLALAGAPSDTSSREPAARITLKTHGTLRDIAERIASEGKLSVVVRGDLEEDAEVFFQNVPADDLEMVFPNVQVRMRLFDKLLIGIPALAALLAWQLVGR